jgi:ABC-2 type transport system permease protein
MSDIAMSTVPDVTAAQRRPSILTNLVRSEWAKLGSVRSTYWSLFVAAVGIVAIGLGAAIGAAHSTGRKATFHPVASALGGTVLAQLAIGVLGVLVVTSEYTTGMIRSTFTAAPQRATVIASKAAIFGAVAFIVGALSSLLTFLGAQAILGSRGVSLGSPGALRAVFGVGLYLGLLGVCAVGLGTLIRRTAGAIAVLFGLLLVLPALAPLLPSSMQDAVGKYLPYNAGQAIFATTRDASTLAPFAGLAVFALYAAAALSIGLTLVRRRDA